jgi:hypothetical protein
VISSFVLFHLFAVSVWTLPACAIKDRFAGPLHYYILPLGIWQWWAIFAPEPVRENHLLEAEVIDAKGLIHIYEFPKLGDLSWWERISRYRHPKFTGNMIQGGEYSRLREFAARHVVRQLGLGDDAFPLNVSLYVRVTAGPPPGSAVADPMSPARIQMIERYQFASLKEVCP